LCLCLCLRRLRGDAAYVVMMSATVIRHWFSARLLAVALGAAPLFGALVVDGLFAGGAFAQGAADGNGAVDQRFVVSDIRVEGLQRIAAGSVFAAMPIAVGDVADAAAIRATARSLFATGNFDDIRIGRDGNVLVVVVAERPSISEITIDGNKAIETEALLDGLKGAGLAVGQVFQRSTLEGMQLELQRQYVTQGRYDAAIDRGDSRATQSRVHQHRCRRRHRRRRSSTSTWWATASSATTNSLTSSS
jgi:outer membrane protein assembly factor BamA